jgi:SAM-dependent methyltransferase
MPEPVRDPQSRFSDRAEDYVKYRPHYSHDVVQALQQACGLTPQHVIADVGCGTGLLAEIFLQNGNRVIGVEPNRAMRLAGESYLAAYPNFRMAEGGAEATTLDQASVDFVAAGQAFHWFKPQEARAEFLRILKPGGWTVLVWHHRDTKSTRFLRAYEDFVQLYATDYEQVSHQYVASYDALQRFFAPSKMSLIQQHNRQRLDLDGLRGRLLSSSYMPKSGDQHEAMMQAVPLLFAKHAGDDRVVLEYDTNIYYGHLDQ